MIFMSGSTAADRPMVLYHAVSSYQLLEVILHRTVFHKKDKAILILPDFITQKYPQYMQLETDHFFDEVYLFPYLHIPHRTEAEIRQDVSGCYKELVPYKITEFSNIYVAGAHFYFSLYLIEKQIPFFFFEDAAGMLSRSEDLHRGLRAKFPIHAEIAKKYGLYDGDNPYICGIICLKKAQTIDVSNPNYLDFSVETALERLTPHRRRRLIRFFLHRTIHTHASAILLTQHFANLGLMNEAEQKQLYCDLSEQLLHGIRLIIKRHPDDTLDYQAIFPDAEVIHEIFPAELLPYVFRKKPQTIYTFNSTGCENLTDHFTIKKIRRNRHVK